MRIRRWLETEDGEFNEDEEKGNLNKNEKRTVNNMRIEKWN